MKSNLKQYVEEVLEEDERTRNDDNWLIIQVLRKYGIKFFIDYGELPRLPAIESIVRTRARIQNEDKHFLPTSELINKKRSVCIAEQEGVTYLKPEVLKEQ